MRGVNRINVLGCPFDAVSFEETVNSIRLAIAKGILLQIVPGSVDFIVKSRRDPNYARVLWRSELVVADGKPIVCLASLLGQPIRGRVSGTDLVWSCVMLSQELTFPIALIGGACDAAKRAASAMLRRFPNALLHSIVTPYPLTREYSKVLAGQVRALGCKLILVALGAPRQERWVLEYLPECGANVGIGIGSAFDIICGDRLRAPLWMQNAGLEWFHRMMLEPRRLGRRYLKEDMRVIGYLAFEMLQRLRRKRL